MRNNWSKILTIGPNWGRNGNNRLGDLDVDARIIFKGILNK
jgi:hypothetical protein